MITFEKIRWKNFLSTGDQFTEIVLNDCSSTLIIGTNGAGKSTMLDALCFVLFNKPFRKINKPQLVNSVNEKGTVVEVEFETNGKNYLVRRTIKPGKFEIYENDELVDQDAAVKDYQKYLEQSILKLNFKSFTQVVILGSSTFVPFMQLPAAHRREVIEDLLDIQIFSVMNTLLKDRVKDTSERGRDCDHMMTLAETKVETQEKHIAKLAEINDERVREKEDEIVTNENRALDLESAKSSLFELVTSKQKEVEGYDSFTKDLDRLKNLRSKIQSKHNTVTKELKFFTDNNTCPTCSQDIEDDLKNHKCTSLTEESSKYADGLGKLEEQIDFVVKTLNDINKVNRELMNLQTDIQQKDRDIINLGKLNLKLQQQIQNLKEFQPNVQEENEILDSLKIELQNTAKNCSDINKQLSEYQTVSYLLKDSGIKSTVIKKYVPVFNQLINKYLQSMEFYVNFTLDNEFNEVIKSRFRDDFSYSSFSEGEKQKIDLALLFTWREVARMKNSASTNLLILDEVFDSSLDDSSTQELLKILRGLEKVNLFVISHKGEILIDKFLRTIKFEKVNDFSKLSYDP